MKANSLWPPDSKRGVIVTRPPGGAQFPILSTSPCLPRAPWDCTGHSSGLRGSLLLWNWGTSISLWASAQRARLMQPSVCTLSLLVGSTEPLPIFLLLFFYSSFLPSPIPSRAPILTWQQPLVGCGLVHCVFLISLDDTGFCPILIGYPLPHFFQPAILFSRP